MAKEEKLTFIDEELGLDDDNLQEEAAESLLPSQQELDSEEAAKMGIPEAAVTSIGQGAGFGLTPLVAGATGVVGEIGEDIGDALGLTTDSDLRDEGFAIKDDNEGLQGLMDAYYAQRDAQIAAQEKASEDQFATSLVGNVVGSIPSTIAASGLVAAGKVPSVLSKFLPKMESMAGLSTAAKAQKYAIEGAKAGGLAGFGSGKAKLGEGELLDTVKETGLSTVGGAAIGSVLPVLGKAISKAPKLLDIIPGTKAIKTGFQAGRKGINITDDEAVATFIEGAGKEIKNKISKAFGADKVSDILENFDKKGIRVNIKNVIDKAKTELKTNVKSKEEVKQITSLIEYLEGMDSRIDNTLQNAVQQAERAQAGKLNKLARKGQEVETRTEFDTPFEELSPLPENQGRVIGVEDKIRVPSTAPDEVDTFKKVISQKSILDDEIPIQQIDYGKAKISDVDEIRSNLYKFTNPKEFDVKVRNVAKEMRVKINENIDEAVNNSSLSDKKSKLSNIFNTLKSLSIDKNKFMSKNPVDQDHVVEKLIQGASAERNSSQGRAFSRAMGYLGMADDSAIKGMQDKSDFLTRLTKVTGQYDAEGSGNITTAVLGSVQKGLAKVSNVAGFATKAVGKEAQHAKKAMYDLIKDSSPENIQELASALSSKFSEKATPFINQLQKAATAPAQRRNALISGVYQQPAFRKMLQELGGSLLMQEREVEEEKLNEVSDEGLKFIGEENDIETDNGISNGDIDDVEPKKKPETGREPQGANIGRDLIKEEEETGYKKSVSKVEKGGVSHTGAVGKYQFTKGTTNALNKKYNTKYDRNNPKDQEKLMDLLTKDNTETLTKMGVPVNNSSLYMAHNVGASTTRNLFNNKGKNSVEVVDEPIIWVANPSFYFKINGKGDRLSGEEINQLLNIIDYKKGSPIDENITLSRLAAYGFIPMTTEETINKYNRMIED